jgi:hypothetical protein
MVEINACLCQLNKFKKKLIPVSWAISDRRIDKVLVEIEKLKRDEEFIWAGKFLADNCGVDITAEEVEEGIRDAVRKNDWEEAERLINLVDKRIEEACI